MILRLLRNVFFLFWTLLLGPMASAEGPIPWAFPKEARLDAGRLVIYSPQVVDWTDYETATLLMAVEYFPDDVEQEKIYATVELTGKTTVDLDERTVSLTERRVTHTRVAGVDKPEYSANLTARITQDEVVAPLDVFLLSLAQDVMTLEESVGFNTTAPVVLVSMSPAIVLSLQGEPQFEPMESTPYALVTNANWPLLKHRTDEAYFLLYKQSWWQSTHVADGWAASAEAPAGLENLDPEGDFKDLLVVTKPATALTIYPAEKPTELIVLDGPPLLEAIGDAVGLMYAINTQSPLFHYGDSWYYLTAGRWFTTPGSSEDLIEENADWLLTTELPEVFKEIPPDHGMAYVRASVAGTLEANTALLEANLPRKKTLSASDYLELTDQFDGEPRFERIPSTSVVRATNSPYDIFEFQGVYYLCYQGAWYQADRAEGPWEPAFRVPDVIYDIPAESPSYPVTQVAVASSTASSVTFSARSSYYTGVYSYYGFPVYGTGWYYPPYYGRHWYYPRFVSYGYGSFYNPRTGNYGTRQVWAGPYGGYSYNQHYSPRSGRSGYVETAWDSDGWASYGETYNPRTGVYSETERTYSDDHERFEMDREVYRGDKSMGVEREVDIDGGWAITDRTTSEGGSSHVERKRESDGSFSSDGSITSGDGKSVDFEGTIDDGQRRTHYESSEGGEMVTGRDGENRGMVGRDGDGDLYAGKNGDVYRKSGDSWYQYDRDDGWNEIQQPSGERAEQWQNNAGEGGVSREARKTAKAWDDYDREKSTRMNQLNRDAHARNFGNHQFEQRRSYSRNRMSSGGISSGRMRSRFR